ncbi:MAG: response regulator [Bacteroidetes bacterium]|nr:response regulator [Bacteroidota bacterium]
MESKLNSSAERQKLLEISTQIASSLDSALVARLLAKGLSGLIDYDTMAIYLANHDRKELCPIIVEGPSWDNPDLTKWCIPFDKGIIGSIIAIGKSERIENAHLDKRALYPEGANIKEEQLIVIPLNMGTICWGALVMNRMSGVFFTEEEFETSRFLASYASLALNNIRLIDQVKERERNLRALLDAIPDNPIKVNSNGAIVDGSYWYDEKKTSLQEIFPASVAQQFLTSIVDVIAKNTPETFNFNIPFENGLQHYEARVIPFSKNECLLLTRDLTEIHRAQEELKDTQALKQVVMDTISDAVITVDDKERIIYCNEVTQKIFGYSSSELNGKSLQTIIPDYLKKIHEAAFANYNKTGVRKHGSWSSLEFPGLHKEGHQVPLEISFGEAVANGKKIFSAIIRDISERKQGQESLKSATSRLQNLILTIQAGVLVEDENRRIVLTNQKFCDMFMIPAPPEVLTGMDCSNAAENSKMLFREPEEFVERINQLLKNRETVVNEELEMVSGKVYARDYVPIFVDTVYKGHMWLYRDITEIKEVEKNLLKAKQQAEESSNAKQDFLAKMSHELRTPINGVLGLTNLMFNSSLSSENLEYLKGIKSSGEQLLSIINDILDLSKIEAGKLTLDYIDFNPKQVITQLVKNLQPQAVEKNISLDVKIFSGAPEYLKGDPVRLSQILLNLLSNALKFTSKGSVGLTCTVVRQNDKKYYLKFTVTDTGIGIPEDKLQMIFERFTQADQPTATKFGGTGLGLTIVKQLTEMQHGDVHVQSVLGMGTTFEVIIPYEEGIAVSTKVDDGNSWTNHDIFEGRSVLLVEDNLINQTVAKKTLEKWKINVAVADNGLIALDLLKKHKFDLIIMDVQMPEMDGYETTHKIRTEMEEPLRSIPIIAMTASVLFDPEVRVKSAGMNEYISKPFKLSDLNSLLTKYLKPSSSQLEQAPAKEIESYLDLAFLESISPDNIAFQLEMIELFQKQSAQYMSKIRLAFEENDLIGLKKNAHAFKPLGSYVGINSLTKIVGQLENDAMNSGTKSVHLENLIQKIQEMLEKVKPEVEAFIYKNTISHVKK